MRRPPLVNVVIALMVLAGITMLTYPSAAVWFQAREDLVALDAYRATITDHGNLENQRRYEAAQEFNRQPSDEVDPETLLTGTPRGIVGSLSIPRTEQVLPIRYGDDHDTISDGVGIVPGTALPVGPAGTRSVITGHAGLASAPVFTRLTSLELGDEFSVSILGEEAVYRVTDIRVVEPAEVDSLQPEAGRELVTLLTCTPLGINSHRLLVTGERQPTATATYVSGEPGFCWWAIWLSGAVLLAGLYLWRSARRAAPLKAPDQVLEKEPVASSA